MLGFECDCSADCDFAVDHVFVSRLVRVNYRQKCGECGRTIRPGEEHEHARQREEGKWSGYRTCLGCYRVRLRFCPTSWYWGGVAELVAECLGFDYRDDPADWDDDEVEEEDADNREAALAGRNR